MKSSTLVLVAFLALNSHAQPMGNTAISNAISIEASDRLIDVVNLGNLITDTSNALLLLMLISLNNEIQRD